MKTLLICIISLVILQACTPLPPLTVSEKMAEILAVMAEPGYRTFLQITVDGEESDEMIQMSYRRISIEKIKAKQQSKGEFKF